jgi:hypothetical protein
MRIAISGKMKSGKTTLAWHLERAFAREGNYSSKTCSFADPIRQALRELGIEKAAHPELYRKGAQYIGTELCRTYDPNWWVKRMAARTDRMPLAEPVIIDDMRFQNEYDWCRENGFILVRLDISPEMVYNRGGEEGTFDHPSETGLDHIEKEEWNLWFSEASSVDQRVQQVLEYAQKAHIFQSGPS